MEQKTSFWQKVKNAITKSTPENDAVINRPYLLTTDNKRQPIDDEQVSKLIAHNYNQDLRWMTNAQIEQHPVYNLSRAVQPEIIKINNKETAVYNGMDIDNMAPYARPPIEQNDKNHNNLSLANGLINTKQMRLQHSLYAGDPKSFRYDPKTNTGFLKHPSQYKNAETYYMNVSKVMLLASCYKAAQQNQDLKQLLDQTQNNLSYATVDQQFAEETLDCMLETYAKETFVRMGFMPKQYPAQTQHKEGEALVNMIDKHTGMSINDSVKKFRHPVLEAYATERLNFDPSNLPEHKMHAEMKYKAVAVSFPKPKNDCKNSWSHSNKN